jgi:hypothetical protein
MEDCMLSHVLDRRRLIIMVLALLAVTGVALAIAATAGDYSGPAQGATAIEYGLL